MTVRVAIDAMGGEAELRAIRTLAIDGMGHADAIEQSERPEGPWMVTYQQVSEIRDHERNRLWRKQNQRNWSIPNWAGPAGIVFADGVVAINAAAYTMPSSSGHPTWGW